LRGIYAHNIADNIEGDIHKVSEPQGLIAKDALCYVDGSDIVIGGYKVDLGLSTESRPKTLVSMGAYIIIMPDKKYINTTNYGDKGKIEATVATEGWRVWFEPCKTDGTLYTGFIRSDTAPQDPQDGQLWMDISSKPYSLKQYSATNAQWIGIATTYIRISFDNAVDISPFNVGDGVTIAGITNEKLLDLNSTMVIKAKGSNYIVVTGIIDDSYESTDNLFITRLMPEMDMVIESGNRLWGCRYGFDIQGNFVNEIYASKLGDFKNWNCFDGISTDSYVATVGTDGQFTGAVTHLGYPIFFKENCIHKVYGNYPANFQVQTINCRGVQEGCHKSLAIVNEVLCYKSRSAVCMYDGSLPVEISSALGDVNYSDAVAGTKGNKYYISMRNEYGEYHLFAFDTKRGLWHKEDNTHAIDFCTCRGDLYYIDETDNIRRIKTIGTDSLSDEDIRETSIDDWMAESGIIGVSLPDKKYISRLDVRMLLTVGTRVHFYIEYDSCGRWEHLFTMTGTKLQSFAVPIRPKRCDHMRIRIEGDGEAKIFSICKTIEQGSDI
jgi:hypothetical protein